MFKHYILRRLSDKGMTLSFLILFFTPTGIVLIFEKYSYQK